jgi:hypothetical protein
VLAPSSRTATLPKIPFTRRICKRLNLRGQKIYGRAAHKLVFLVGRCARQRYTEF